MHVAALLAALRMHAKACAADMLSLSGVVMPLLPLLATVGQEHSAAAAADKANHLHMQKVCTFCVHVHAITLEARRNLIIIIIL